MRLKITDAPYFVKIPVRLKISVGSKNFGVSVGKPSGVAQVFRTSERIAGSTGRKAGEQQTNKFLLYIGIEKYLQKSKKKFANKKNGCNFVSVIKQQTYRKGERKFNTIKRQSNENN